jgi:hypothetical protein
MKTPLLEASGGERSVSQLHPTEIPTETKVAIFAALFICGSSQAVLFASTNILIADNCHTNDGAVSFIRFTPFFLVPLFAAFSDMLRGSVFRRQPFFTAGVIVSFLSIGLLGISAHRCAFVTSMLLFSYMGISTMAALAVGILLDRLHRCSFAFAVQSQVFFAAIPLLLGVLVAQIFIYFDLCTRAFLIGFSLALMVVMFMSLLVPDIVVLSKANLMLELTTSHYAYLFNWNYVRILLFVSVWKLLPLAEATLESLFVPDLNVRIYELQFIFYASRIVGAVKFWWLLNTNVFKGYFKANLFRSLFFILTAQGIFLFISVIITAQPPTHMLFSAVFHYLTSGLKDGFSFAYVLVLGSRMHSEALNSVSCTLIVSIFCISAVGGSALSDILASSFPVSSGQGWIAVFICAVLHLVPLIIIRYTVDYSDPRELVSPATKGISALEVSFQEVNVLIVFL